MRRAVLLLALGAMLGLATSALALSAEAASLSDRRVPASLTAYDSFDAVWDLHRDADGASRMIVTETMRMRFPEGGTVHGPYRVLPTMNNDIPLDVQGFSARMDGADVPFTVTDVSRGAAAKAVEVRIGDPHRYVTGSHTFVLRYTMRNVVRRFDDPGDAELYWNVNGEDWDGDWGEVRVELRLHDGIAADLTGHLKCYAPTPPAASPCRIRHEGDEIVSSAGGVPSDRTLTVAVGFRAASFAEPPREGQRWPWSVLPWLLLTMAVAAVGWGVRLRRGPYRSAPGRVPIVPQYEGPPGVDAAQVAVFERRAARALAAGLVGLAVRGTLAIETTDGAPSATRYTARLLASSTEELSPSDGKLIRALFGTTPLAGDHRTLDGGDKDLGRRVGSWLNAVTKSVSAGGYRETPKGRVRWWGFLALAVVGILGPIVHIVAAAIARGLAPTLVCVDIGAGIASVVALVLWLPRERTTSRGRELEWWIAGLKDYLRLAEEDRLRFLQGPDTALRIDAGDGDAVLKLYERALPYAVALGLAGEWATALRAHQQSDPSATLPTELPWQAWTELAVQGSAIASMTFGTPLSDGGSTSGSTGGSTGGGFSGGGGGGGGGGTW